MKNTVRIIGGQWRSRKIAFPTVTGLRPSADRCRETLFNWLGHDVVGRVCLDLFAGSGALGFEALSRGASWVSFVDNHPEVIASLKASAQKLQSTQQEIQQAHYPNLPSFKPQQFDLVFLDPPFAENVIIGALNLLKSRHLLTEDALIYCEAPKDFNWQLLEQDFQLKKQKTSQQVTYTLWAPRPQAGREESREND